MKILVTVLMTALFVFALASTWVDFVQPQLDLQARLAAEKQAAKVEQPAPRKRVRKVAAPVEEPLLPVPEEATDVVAAEPKPTRKAVPAKATEGEAEAAALLTDVKEQESKLAVRQEALKMIYDDIRTELAAVDDLRKRAREDMAEVELKMIEVAQRTSRSNKTKPIANPNRLASEAGPIRSQALIIRKMVDEGRMETAVSILKAMKERDAASILTSLDAIDGPLAERLARTVQSGRDDVIRR